MKTCPKCKVGKMAYDAVLMWNQCDTCRTYSPTMVHDDVDCKNIRKVLKKPKGSTDIFNELLGSKLIDVTKVAE